MTHLWLIGLDHTTAPVTVREQVAFDADAIERALAELTQGAHAPLREAAILATCNRVEIYGAGDESAGEALLAFLARFHGREPAALRPHLFLHEGEAVAQHLCAVAAGLRSLVLGEAQIQGQVRQAHERAAEAGGAGPILGALFRHALAAGGRVRSETALGLGAASVSQAAVELARQRLGDLGGRSVLLIGSGKVGELAARTLRANGAGALLVANRTMEHAQALAERWGGEALPLEDLEAGLARAEIAISSTAAPAPIITRPLVERALAGRGAGPGLLLLDLAVPRDVAEDVGALPGVSLLGVDDLHGVVGATLARRGQSLAAAEAIAVHEAAAFALWLREREALPALAALRQRAEALRAAELDRTLRRLDLDASQREAVEALSRSLVNKLLHAPTLRVKGAAAQGQGERYAEMLSELFGLTADR
jgi:glutamyl-tRNA reductase